MFCWCGIKHHCLCNTIMYSVTDYGSDSRMDEPCIYCNLQDSELQDQYVIYLRVSSVDLALISTIESVVTFK